MKEKDDRLVAHVIEALCKGCGAYGTACPTKVIAFETLYNGGDSCPS